MLDNMVLLFADATLGVEPATIVGEAGWLVAGLAFAVLLPLSTFFLAFKLQWVHPVFTIPAAVAGILLGIVLAAIPITHGHRFRDCEVRIVTIELDGEQREVGAKYCRVRETLDSDWGEWELREIGGKYVAG